MRVPWRRPGEEEGGVSLLQRPLALNGAAAAAAEISVTLSLLLHKYTVYTLSLSCVCEKGHHPWWVVVRGRTAGLRLVVQVARAAPVCIT